MKMVRVGKALGCPWNLVINCLVSWVVTYLGNLLTTRLDQLEGL